MAKIVFDPLVTDTSHRLYGLGALIELIYRATPAIEIQERDALEELAERDGWEYGDFAVEDQLLDIKFGHWVPKLAHYSIIILLSSIVETQLLAFAKKIGKREKCTFEPGDLRGSALEKVALYVKRASELELTQNPHWKTLKDLQDLRDVIVHRAGRPGTDKAAQFGQMIKNLPLLSLAPNPHGWEPDDEIDVSIHACRYFAKEVEIFFKELFKQAGLPAETGLWPNIESGL